MKASRLLGLVLLALPLAASAGPRIGFFLMPPIYQQVSISPKGDYVAARVPVGDAFGLEVIRLSDKKRTALLSMGLGRDLAGYVWASPTRLVVEPAIFYGGYEQPAATGELMAVNFDGSDQKYLFGYRGESEGETNGTLIRAHNNESNSWARILRSLPDDPAHVLAVVGDFGDIDTRVNKVCKVNIETAFRDSCISAPNVGEFNFMADRAGNVRYAISAGDDFHSPETYVRKLGKGDWARIAPPIGKSHIYVYPQAVSRDGSKVYLLSDEGDDRLCLVEQVLATEERRILSCDPVADVAEAIFSFDGNEPIGALYDSDKPRIDLLETQNPDALTLKQLEASFGGELVIPTSYSWDGGKVILAVASDRDPGGYYLYDVKTRKASPLFPVRYEILPENMGERRPIVFKARDGQLIHGYLTIPQAPN